MTIDSPLADPASVARIVPIGDLVRRVAALLERSFPPSWVSGELSNLTRAASGHWYFSMKDRDAQVRCVMFRNRNQHVDWVPRDGDRVEARVLPGLYAARGEFQLQVEQMRRAGAGVLFEAFLRIKSELEAAGLFDAGRKRPLPRHPRVIGVVTSMQAAALRDVLTTIARRAPHVAVILFPTPVQGQDAPSRIAEAIGRADVARHAVDVLLVVRGGGSIEDLWAFNDERVAYAIAAARMPVVSGVGHETDFTIADFVADFRAPTPTAAAELASPDAAAWSSRLAQRSLALRRASERLLNASTQRLDDATRRLRSPDQRVRIARDRLDAIVRRLGRAEGTVLSNAARSLDAASLRLRAAAPDPRRLAERHRSLATRFARAMAVRVRIAADASNGVAQRLALLDPRGILGRGYAIATDAAGLVVRDPSRLQSGERVTVEVAAGRFATRVVVPDDDR